MRLGEGNGLSLLFFPLLFILATAVCAEPAGIRDEWPVSPLRPYDVAALGDGSVWFTHKVESGTYGGPIVFTIDPMVGSIKRCDESFDGPVDYETLDGAPDNTLWIADSRNNRIVHFDPERCADPASEDLATANPQPDAFDADGYSVPPTADEDPAYSVCEPYGLSVADDGSVWVACDGAPYIARFDPSMGASDEAWVFFDVQTEEGPPVGPPRDIAFGPDGLVWFTTTGHPSYGGNAALGRLDPMAVDGDVRLWINPDELPTRCFPAIGRPLTFHGITVDGGNVWFVDHSNSSLLRYDSGADDFACFPMPGSEDDPPRLWDVHYLEQDRDGVLWMTGFGMALIGTFDPATETFDDLPLRAQAQPMGITLSPNGEVWWAEAGSGGDQGGIGRFRPTSILLSILEPSEADPVWAGTSTYGNRVFVRLVGAEDMDWSDTNLSIAIDGVVVPPDEDPITLHSTIESETWLVIEPGERPADCYDLTVGFIDHPEVSATASDSLCYSDAEDRVVNRVVAMDRTNSMNYDSVTRVRSEEKMNAARAAGKFFVDLSNDLDGIGVVSFQRSDENGNGSIEDNELSESEFPLTPAINEFGEDQREAGHTAIDDIAPSAGPGGAETSLGAGLLEAKVMLDAPEHADSEKVIVLVTDGRENFPPFWSSESREWYEGSGPTLEPLFADPLTRITIDTVSIGLDAEDEVLHAMSDLTGGTLRNELEGSGSFGLLSRLAATFKSIDENNRGEQRFYYRKGWPEVSVGGEFEEIKEAVFTVEENLDWITVAFHWNTDGAGADLRLLDPDRNPVETSRTDPKHAVYHVRSPRSGVWRYQVSVNNPGVEFLAAASGPTQLTAGLRIGDTESSEPDSWVTPLRVWIADRRAVLDAEVSAVVRRPDKSKFSVILLDDGSSADGAAGDGVYGTRIDERLSGPYAIDLVATGISDSGEPFERFLIGTVVIPGASDRPGQVGEDVPGYDGWVTTVCGGAVWCCWLWLGFILALIAALLLLLWLLCHYRTIKHRSENTTTIATSANRWKIGILLAVTVVATILGWWLLVACPIALCWFLLSISLAIIVAGLIACLTPVVPCLGMRAMG